VYGFLALHTNFVERHKSEVQLRRRLTSGKGQLPKALRRHNLRTPSLPSLIGDLGDRVCTTSSYLGPSQFYSPGTVFRDEDLQAHMGVFVLWKDDNDNKVNVYSDVALLPQDFESVDTVSQRHPEAQSRT
jgi:hypothetical protein